jgi:hypothetical protein
VKKEREKENVALQQKGRGLNWQTNIAHLSSVEKAGQKKEGKKIDFFLLYTLRR